MSSVTAVPGNKDNEIVVSFTTQGAFDSAYVTVRSVELRYSKTVQALNNTIVVTDLLPATTYEFQVELTIGEASENGYFVFFDEQKVDHYTQF